MTRRHEERGKAHSTGRKVRWAVVDRPGDVGLDLPAGKSAQELGPADYHPIEMERPMVAARGAAGRPGERKAARRSARR